MQSRDIVPLSYLKLKCPTELPEEHRAQCFYNPGTCESCLYQSFREKIEDDARTRQEIRKTILEEMQRWQRHSI